MHQQILGISAAIVVVALVWYVWSPVEPVGVTGRLVVGQNLEDRTIVGYEMLPDGTVKYQYVGEVVPESLAPTEAPELRTENSYTEILNLIETGPEPAAELRTTFFSQPTFTKDANGTWRTIEYATTTHEAWLRTRGTFANRLYQLMLPVAHAADFYAGSGDGGVTYSAAEEALISCTGQASGTAASPTGNTITVGVFNDTTPGAFLCTVQRGYLPFSTATIPAAATITGATLNIYVTAKQDGDNDGDDYVTVLQTTQSDEATLGLNDYSEIGIDSGVTGGADITAISTSAYLALTLNSAGLAWIAKSGVASSCGVSTGVTCLGLRVGHDLEGIGLASLATNSITFRASEFTGTSNDPYLSVTYTAPQSTVVKLKSGVLKVNGGRFKLQSN